MPTLRVISGPAAGKSLEIEREMTLGRENADVDIPDSEMSRRHAALRVVGEGVEIEDLGSLNGTYVNGQRITERVTLTSSARIKLGTSEMAVEVPPPPAPAAEAEPLEGLDPNATKAAAVVPPGSEAPPQPDVTKARPVVSSEPDVTKARPVVPPAPDVTRQRPVPTAPPAAAAGRPATPPAEGRRGRGPRGGRGGGAPAEGRKLPLPMPVIGALVIALVIVILVLFVL